MLSLSRCRGRGRHRSWLWFLLWAGILSTPLGAQTADDAASPAAEESIAQSSLSLENDLRRQLGYLQDDWIDWVGAFDRGDRPSLELAAQSLAAGAAELGFSTLPDLGHAAASRAYLAAKSGDFPRAYAALESANLFAPGSPGVAFAEAAVARLNGEYVNAVGRSLAGYARLATDPYLGTLWWLNVARWLSIALFLGGLLFAAVQMAGKGSRVLVGLAQRLERWLPKPVAAVLVLVLLSWPILLPNGIVWVAVLWCLALWRAFSAGERVVAALVVAILLATPWAGDLISARVRPALTPAADGIEGFARGEFRGTLFNDLAEAVALSGDEPPVLHLIGDVHRRLGQWEIARFVYGELLQAQPGNAAALLELGNYHFELEEFNRAIDYFKQSSEAEATPQAFFNLSQAYSAIYAFDQAERSLRRARDLDDDIVTLWVREGAGRAVPSAGLDARATAMAAGLRQSAGDGSGGPAFDALLIAVPVLVLGLLLAVFAEPAARAPGGAGSVTGAVQALLPGLSSAQSDSGGRALAACVTLAAFVSLPLMAGWGLSLPLGFWPGYLLLNGLAIAGLLIWLGLRFLTAD